MDIVALMEGSRGHYVKIILCDGSVVEGTADIFETAYDNDEGEASLCVRTTDIDGICLFESEIKSIEYDVADVGSTDRNKVDLMEESLGRNVKLTLSDGSVVVGNVKGFETAYDNADDDGGKAEASICLITTDGEGVGFYESNIQSIEIL